MPSDKDKHNICMQGRSKRLCLKLSKQLRIAEELKMENVGANPCVYPFSYGRGRKLAQADFRFAAPLRRRGIIVGVRK
jgi:hypothetical protein